MGNLPEDRFADYFMAIIIVIETLYVFQTGGPAVDAHPDHLFSKCGKVCFFFHLMNMALKLPKPG